MAFCVTPPHPMASCIPLKEGASVTGKWKNCNTFLSFCLPILSQIRSRGVASVLCSTMGSIGLLEMVDAPLQKIKKASSHTVFHVISQDITIFLMKSGSGKAWTQIKHGRRSSFNLVTSLFFPSYVSHPFRNVYYLPTDREYIMSDSAKLLVRHDEQCQIKYVRWMFPVLLAIIQ